MTHSRSPCNPTDISISLPYKVRLFQWDVSKYELCSSFCLPDADVLIVSHRDTCLWSQVIDFAMSVCLEKWGKRNTGASLKKCWKIKPPFFFLIIVTVKELHSWVLTGLSRFFKEKICCINWKKKTVLFGFSTYSKEDFLANKDCAGEIRCRVSFAVLSVFSAVLALPQLQWELTITTKMFFLPLLFLQMDLWDLNVWKPLPGSSIKGYLTSFSQRELQETERHSLNFTGVTDMDTLEGHFSIIFCTNVCPHSQQLQCKLL